MILILVLVLTSLGPVRITAGGTGSVFPVYIQTAH